MAGDDALSVLLYQVGVNMGDHGETVVKAVEVDDEETVRALLDRLIPVSSKWRNREYEHYVVLRFVQPAAEPDPVPTVETEPF